MCDCIQTIKFASSFKRYNYSSYIAASTWNQIAFRSSINRAEFLELLNWYWLFLKKIYKLDL